MNQDFACKLPVGQIKRALGKSPVQSLAQKYFAFAVGQITGLNPRVSPK
jgi:hypothetical protein